MATNLPKPLWYVLGIMVVGCGLYTLIWYAKKSKGRKTNPPVTPVNPIEPIVGTQITPISPVIPDISEEIRPIIKFLGGFMNSFLSVIQEYDAETAKMTFKNFKQVINGHGSEKLKKWYFKLENDRNVLDEAFYKSKAAEILNILKGCGVNRSFEIKGEWNSIAEQHYRKIGSIEYGQHFEVLEPCWIYENEVLEKGLAKKIN